MNESGLYVVATPIGNLEDISARALRILAEADLIAAEDTRRTRQLLQHFGIDTPLQALHEHNEEQMLPSLLGKLREGALIALVSDAGTPLISDPGYRLVKQVAREGVPVFPVPGPAALIAALSVAGLPTDRFVFEGFLPVKAAARRNYLAGLVFEPGTLVFYESSHRIEECLADMGSIFGLDREVVVCRELTKKFETTYRGTLETVAAGIGGHADHRRGEFVIIVAGQPAVPVGLAEAVKLARMLQEHLPASQAARLAAKHTGCGRREIYAQLED